MSSALKAGVASVNISPPIGVDLTGFGNRTGPCIGIHDDIHAKALVLDNGSTRVGIVTTDLLGLDPRLVDQIRTLAKDTLGIQPESLMLNSSHTHSAPAANYLRGLGNMDGPYCDCLVRKIVGALRMAVDDLAQAQLFAGTGNVQVGINRRERIQSGGMKLGSNPEGPVCTEVQVLRVDCNGQTKAVLHNHAAHPVVLGGDNLLVSADFVGYANAGVQRLMGDSVTALFAQGCCGNINARLRKTFDAAAKLGRILAGATVATAESAEPLESCELGGASTQLQLPYLPPPTVDEAQAQLDKAKADLKAIEGQDVTRGKRMMDEAMVAWAEDSLRVAKGESDDTAAEFEVQALRIGDVAVVGLEGEVFVQYEHNIRAASRYATTMVLAYTNGCIGYVPDAAAYPFGGYEVTMAYKMYATQMIAPESEGIILAEAKRLLGGLKG